MRRYEFRKQEASIETFEEFQSRCFEIYEDGDDWDPSTYGDVYRIDEPEDVFKNAIPFFEKRFRGWNTVSAEEAVDAIRTFKNRVKTVWNEATGERKKGIKGFLRKIEKVLSLWRLEGSDEEASPYELSRGFLKILEGLQKKETDWNKKMEEAMKKTDPELYKIQQKLLKQWKQGEAR